MKKIFEFLVYILSILLAVHILCSFECFAQEGGEDSAIRKRWWLDFKMELPDIFVYSDLKGHPHYCWYTIYEVANKTGQDVQVNISMVMQLDKNRSYANGFFPEVETKIIEKVEKLTFLSEGVRKVRIENLKKNNRYLNTKDIAEKFSGENLLKNGESFTGIAIFYDVDTKIENVVFAIAGLVDPVIYNVDVVYKEKGEEDIPYFLYESKILKYYYEGNANPLNIANAVLEFQKREWATEVLGPIGGMVFLENLTKSIEDEEAINRRVSYFLLLTYLDIPKENIEGTAKNPQWFGFDVKKTIDENKRATMQIREWMLKNLPNLTFDDKKQKYTLKKEE